MSDPPLKDCPKCGKEVRRLIFGGTGVIFKGSGFYVTDRNKSSGKTEAKTSSPRQGADNAAKNGSDLKQNPSGGETVKNSADKTSPETKSA